MKIRLIIIFTCLFCLSVLIFSGCTTLSPNLTPLSDQDVFFNNAGIDIKRPSGNNWYWYTPQKNVIAFSQIPDSETHSFLVSVYTINLFYKKFSDQSKFLQYVRKQKEKDTDPIRFKNVKFDMKLDRKYGKYCVKYKIECKDQKVSALTNQEVYMHTIGYFFLHPDVTRLSYDVFYSERGTLNEFNPNLTAIGEEFINMNVSITDPSNRKL
jgi:hypothetical protein